MRKILIALLSVVLIGPIFAYAGEGGGTSGVGQIQVWAPNWVYFRTEFHNNAPECATTDKWLIDLDTSAGRAMLAVLLSAQASGISVTVWGTGDCNGHLGETEVAAFISQDIDFMQSE